MSDKGKEPAAEQHKSGKSEKSEKNAVQQVIEEEQTRIYMERMKQHIAEEHKFWDTQPVPKLTETITEEKIGPIEVKTVADVPTDPMPLPSGFKWVLVNIEDPKELQEVYVLLEGHYVEDDDEMFRFQYSTDLLLWALKPPGWIAEWFIGVRVEKSNKLVGFITAVPGVMNLFGKPVKTAEVNFLCVHKKLRTKRLAPVLIKEVTRRVNLKNIWQAVYTSGTLLPKPVATCQYYHRSLNPQKLVDVEFSGIPQNATMKMMIRLYSLPSETVTPGFRPMEQKDVGMVTKLLCDKCNEMKMAPNYDEEFWAHTLLPRDGVIYSYVVETNGKATDVVSFYSLPSTIIGHPKYDVLNVAYLFYTAASHTPLEQLMNDALIVAKQLGYDVFNCLDLADNKSFIKNLKFQIGDGKLQYYLFNYRLPAIEPSDLSLVLV